MLQTQTGKEVTNHIIHFRLNLLTIIFFFYPFFQYMNHPKTSKSQQQSNTHSPHSHHKLREVYISPLRDSSVQQSKDQKGYITTPGRFLKNQPTRANDTLPPRAVPFRRSRNISKDRTEQFHEDSQNKSATQVDQTELRHDLPSRIAKLQKKLSSQICQKQRWRQLNTCIEQRALILSQQIDKIRNQKIFQQKELESTRRQLNESREALKEANQNLDLLNKNLRQCRINQKSLSNLKNIQNQLDFLQERNKKLLTDIQELTKSNRIMKGQLNRKRKESTSESQACGKKQDKTISLELQIKRLKAQLEKDKSERQKLLEQNLHQFQKKMYEKQNQLRKVSIQLNCIDRKKSISIDQVKNKKDQQLKELRQKFMKVSKDLRDTKDKIQKTEKKRSPKEIAFIRKVKSSKLIGLTSESEQVTFQLSSEA